MGLHIDGIINQKEVSIMKKFSLRDVPEFQRFQAANPQDLNIDPYGVMVVYGRAIHWMSILEILWPNFEKNDHLSVEVAYVVVNDPDDKKLPQDFFQYIAGMIAMFWKLQLSQEYPDGDWSVDIDDDPEITVWAEIRSRK
jgi:hypothetical protein